MYSPLQLKTNYSTVKTRRDTITCTDSIFRIMFAAKGVND